MSGPRLQSTAAANVVLALSVGAAAFVAARMLGPTGFGDYSLAVTLASLTALVLSAGTGVALKLQVDKHGDLYTWPYIVFSLIVAVLCFIVLIPLTMLFDRVWTFALAVGALGCTSMLARQAIDGFHARGLSERAISFAAAGAVAGLVGMLLLRAMGVLSASTAVWATALATTFPVIPYALYVTAVDRRQHLGKADWAAVSRLVRVGLPSLGNSAGLVVLQRADRILLALMAGPTALGIYSVAAGVGETARLAPMSIGQVAFYRASRCDLKAERRLRIFALSTAAGLGLITIALAPVVVPWAFGAEYSSAVRPLQILAIGEIAFTLSFVDSRLLLGRGRVAEVGMLSAAVATVGVVLYAAAIPRYGVNGAAWASVASYALLSLACASAYHRFRRSNADRQPT